MRKLTLLLGLLAVLLGGLAAAAGSGATVTGRLSAADHEAEEGYFSLGPDTFLVAKPGSELHGWLMRHRGERVRLALTATPDTE